MRASQRAHNLWFGKLCRAPVGYFRASRAVMFVLNLFSLDVRDSKLQDSANRRQLYVLHSIRFTVTVTNMFEVGTFILVFIPPSSFLLLLILLLSSSFSSSPPYLHFFSLPCFSSPPLSSPFPCTLTPPPLFFFFSSSSSTY